MFFIAGVSPRTKAVGAAPGICPACGRQGELHLIKQGQMTSLFFVPLIPLGGQYLATCPGCASLMEVDKAAGKAVERGEARELGRGNMRVVKNHVGLRCPGCRHRVEPGQNYCPHCGQSL